MAITVKQTIAHVDLAPSLTAEIVLVKGEALNTVYVRDIWFQPFKGDQISIMAGLGMSEFELMWYDDDMVSDDDIERSVRTWCRATVADWLGPLDAFVGIA